MYLGASAKKRSISWLLIDLSIDIVRRLAPVACAGATAVMMDGLSIDIVRRHGPVACAGATAVMMDGGRVGAFRVAR